MLSELQSDLAIQVFYTLGFSILTTRTSLFDTYKTYKFFPKSESLLPEYFYIEAPYCEIRLYPR